MAAWRAAGGGITVGLDPAQVQHDRNQPEHPAQNETAREPVFIGLLKDWTVLGCIRITAPSLSDVISGAADWGYCPRGTGWPVEASA